MKIKKLGLSVILIVTMLNTTIGSSLVFANDTVSYSTSVDKMQQQGILDKTISDVNSVVTRSQLAKAISIADVLAFNITNSSDFSGYVNAVADAGLMQSLPDGYFHPEKVVTYGQACTIFVRLLGYADSDPELKDISWPSNYIQEAYKLKLTTGIALKSNDKLTYNVEAVMFDNLFNTLIKGSTTVYFSDKYTKNQASNITGSLVERIILGNSKTTDVSLNGQSLTDDEVLTDKGIYTIQSGAGSLELGVKYKLYLDGTVITKVSEKENVIENYAVSNVSAETISYSDDNGMAKTMTLPTTNAYYYHGVYTNYQDAIKYVQPYSSIILTKNIDNSGFDYGVIVDPNFGEPQVYRFDNAKLLDQIKNTKYTFIYRDANIQESNLNTYDVVYFVSDIWKKNTFIYVNNKTVIGTITAFVPNILNPTGVTINGKDYTFSPYFIKTRLNNYDGSIGNFKTNTNINDFKTLILGVDGKIVDIY